MLDLESFHAYVCYTSAGVLIHHQRILLIKHKKLQIWLPPGGHIDEHELPNQAAEREFFEETGIKVTVISSSPILTGTISQYLPNPFAINLHWISKSNYQARLKDHQKHGCEQHLTFCYLMKPNGNLNTTQNIQETDAIGWFTAAQVKSLNTTEDIKTEIATALHLAKTHSNIFL